MPRISGVCLEVRVAGPDGFSATVPLEAAGCRRVRRQSAARCNPGAYVATAVDEQSNGEALGTTAAALSAGEELRPTGTDRGLLHNRITQVTGGKMRDTISRHFFRPARRCVSRIENLNQLLVVLAAAFLLLGVAARRLAVPDFASHASAALGSWVTSARRRKPRAERTREQNAQQQALQSLREAKNRSDAALPTPFSELIVPAPAPMRGSAKLVRGRLRPRARRAFLNPHLTCSFTRNSTARIDLLRARLRRPRCCWRGAAWASMRIELECSADSRRIASVALVLGGCGARTASFSTVPDASERVVATPSRIAVLSAGHSTTGLPGDVDLWRHERQGALFAEFPPDWRAHGARSKALSRSNLARRRDTRSRAGDHRGLAHSLRLGVGRAARLVGQTRVGSAVRAYRDFERARA